MSASTQNDRGQGVNEFKSSLRGVILFLARAADFLPVIFLLLLVAVITYEVPDGLIPLVIAGPFAAAVLIALIERFAR